MHLRTHQGGFTLVEALIGAALLLFALIGMGTLHFESVRLARQNELQAAVVMREAYINRILSDPELCRCNLTTLDTRSLSVNTTTIASPDIDLRYVRDTCDFSATNNFAVRETQDLAGITGLRVQSVRLRGIAKTSATGNRYTAFVETSVIAPNTSGFRPLRNFVTFDIDPTAGSPAARPIRDCVGRNVLASGLSITCPPSHVQMGPFPGNNSIACIERAVRPARTRAEALVECYNTTYPGFPRSRLCYVWDMMTACWNFPAPTGLTSTAPVEWMMHPGTFNMTAGTCSDNWDASADVSRTEAFRCCLE